MTLREPAALRRRWWYWRWRYRRWRHLKGKGPQPPPFPARRWGRSSHASGRAPKRKNIKHESGIEYRKADLGDARAFRWAWEDRVLIGYLNLLVGVEGIGKGNLIAWLLAGISQGKLPGHLFGTPRGVAIVGDEDSYENVWVPRLYCAGANLDLVNYIAAGTEGVLDVKADANALGSFVEDLGIAVVYFDQLLDNLGVTDSWKDKQVRDALAPVRAVAQKLDLALLATMHPNKRQGSFRERISGTPAFNAMSRSSLLVAPHPSEPGRSVVVRGKGNYSKEPPAFEFRIEEVVLTKGRRGREPITTSRIAGERETSLTAGEVLGSRQGSGRRDDSKIGIARRVLSEMFDDGEPRRAGDVQHELWLRYGLRARAVTEAANQLAFRKWQEGFPGEWWWQAAVERVVGKPEN